MRKCSIGGCKKHTLVGDKCKRHRGGEVISHSRNALIPEATKVRLTRAQKSAGPFWLGKADYGAVYDVWKGADFGLGLVVELTALGGDYSGPATIVAGPFDTFNAAGAEGRRRGWIHSTEAMAADEGFIG